MANRPITMRGRQLGLALRRLRTDSKQSADDVAARLGWSQSKVTRMENGVTAVTRPDLLRLLDHYGVTDDDRRSQFLKLSRVARERGWWVDYREVIAGTLPTYIAFESDASDLQQWSWAGVPGLLQTPAYARAILQSDLEVRTQETVDRLVEARLARQERLREAEVRLWAVLDESLLRRAVGGTEVLREQLSALLAPRPNVTLQLMPAAVKWHPGLNGAFTIMHFPSEGHPPIAFSEGAAGDLYVDAPPNVARYRMAFDHLRAAALSPVESTAVIAELRDRL